VPGIIQHPVVIAVQQSMPSIDGALHHPATVATVALQQSVPGIAHHPAANAIHPSIPGTHCQPPTVRVQQSIRSAIHHSCMAGTVKPRPRLVYVVASGRFEFK
jgi:hypothetical protein